MAQTFRNRIIDYGVKPADQFLANPKNARVHPQFQRDVMKAALEEVGFVAPVIESKSGVLLDGHERIWQAMQNDNAAVPFVVVDVDEAEEDYVLATFDPITSLANYDARLLDDLLRDVNSDQPAIQKMLAELAENNGLYGDEGSGADDPGAQIDRAAELQEQWQVKRGDLWIIPSKSGKGEHRLLCGDSTNADDVTRVMGGERAGMVFTDPPYGVEYEGGTTKRDALSGDETPDLYEPALKLMNKWSDDKAALYLWHSDSKSAAVSAAVSAAGYERRCTIIWNKNQAQFGALGAQYKTKHEPCYYLFKRGQSPNWYGATNEVTVWDVDRSTVNEYHPTQKPPELAVRAMRNSSQLGDVIYDAFNGSGSTIVACEQLGRQCRAIEIEPKYVAVTLQRLADMGLTPELQGAT